MPPKLPYRVSFLCPEITIAGPEGDALCEIIVQWLALNLVQNDGLVVIPPERFPAVEDAQRQTHDFCEADEGLSERYMHARASELLWLEIDTKNRVTRLFSRTLLGDIEKHGEMGGAFSVTAETLLQAWAQRRGRGRIVGPHDRIDMTELEIGARLLPDVMAAVERGDVKGALTCAETLPSLKAALIGIALRKSMLDPPDELLEVSAPKTVRAVKGDALAYAYFAWSLAPDDALTLFGLAEILMKHGRFAEAQRMADRAARIVPGLAKAHALACEATAAVGRCGEAYAEAQEREDVLRDEGMQVIDVRKLVEVRDRLRGAVARDEAYFRGDIGAVLRDAAVSPLFRARALSLLEYPDAAQRALAPALPPQSPAWLALAEAYATSGNEAATLWMLSATAARFPQDRIETDHARILRLISALPIEALEKAITACGTSRLTSLVARDLADAHPEAKDSAVIKNALPKHVTVRFSEVWLEPLREAIPDHFALLDRIFAHPENKTATLLDADRMVSAWHAVVSRFSTEIGIANPDNPDVVPTLAYVAGQAVARYLAASTGTPSLFSLAYRQIASEALAAARVVMLDAEEASVLLEALEPALKAADPALADLWLARVERAFDLELVLGAHIDAYAEDLPTVSGLFLGDEHLGAFQMNAKDPHDWERLARHTGQFYDKVGDALLAALVKDPVATIDAHLTAIQTDDYDGPPTAATSLRKQAFLAIEGSDLQRAQAIAAKAVATDPEDWSAWLALLISSDHREPGTGNDLPADALKLARSVLELSLGATGENAARLRLHASRIVESRCFALDRLPPVE
jgi:tetratricopeptide (TPR) repeat protein